MSLHYLNPDDEPRECPCKPVSEWNPQGIADARCATCNGTGRLGVEGAEPEITVWMRKPYIEQEIANPQWFWQRLDYGDKAHGPFNSEDEALETARNRSRRGY